MLVNVFTVAPEDADGLVAAWTEDAAYLKGRPGFISTQLHRGIAGSSVFLNYAVWDRRRTSSARSPTRSSRRAC